MNLEQLSRAVAPYTFANKRYSKLFGIGYNKTGTTSLEQIFRILGLQVPNQIEQEVRIVRQMWLGNHEPLKEFVARYDAFQDLPFSQGVTFAQVDVLFPRSKFILTVREPEQWYESLCRFACKAYGVSSVDQLTEAYVRDHVLYLYRGYTYDGFRRRVTVVRDGKLVQDWSLLFDKDSRIADYRGHNELVLRYFQDRPDDLLVIDLSRERDVGRILDFLDIPRDFNFPVPHENRTA